LEIKVGPLYVFDTNMEGVYLPMLYLYRKTSMWQEHLGDWM
jgi:hypothetical protein